ncbi:MAG TPA: efflux RND transporter periplasmic adaptor subunit [Alphaproteobacteria bacterium]|nr:efflux RND transporter periplasmic adaptor subunit [Alphaproteobacteria bacterium]
MNTAIQIRTRVAPRRTGWRRWRFVALAALLIAIAATAAWAVLGGNSAPQGAQPLATVELGDIEDNTTALGNLQPRDYVDVGTQVSGQLRKLYFHIGDTVEKGALLAEIDPTVYMARVEANRAQLLNLRAQLADKQAQLALAQQQFQRQTNLARASATSQEAVQSAEAAQRSAAAQVDALRAQIQQTESTLKGDEANLGYTKIYAPMSGTIVSQTAKQGQTLNANQQAPIIYRIADLSTMTVTTQVSEADVSKLRIGMDAYFTTLGQPDRRWYGTLRQVLPTPEVLNNVVLYNALFDVPNPTGELMTQMSAQVFFVSAAAKNVPLVPMAALRPARREDNAPRGSFVAKVIGPDGTVEDRVVTVGVMNRVAAEVKSGLSAGEQVVLPTAPPGPRAGQQQRPMRTPRLS